MSCRSPRNPNIRIQQDEWPETTRKANIITVKPETVSQLAEQFWVPSPCGSQPGRLSQYSFALLAFVSFIPDVRQQPTHGTQKVQFILPQRKLNSQVVHRFLVDTVSRLIDLSSVQFRSVTQSCLTLCNPMDCSTPCLPDPPQLLEFTQNSCPLSR